MSPRPIVSFPYDSIPSERDCLSEQRAMITTRPRQGKAKVVVVRLDDDPGAPDLNDAGGGLFILLDQALIPEQPRVLWTWETIGESTRLDPSSWRVSAFFACGTPVIAERVFGIHRTSREDHIF
jgi:hypothetical protein